MELEFGYGTGVQKVTVPDRNVTDILLSNPMEHPLRGEAAVRHALAHPIGAPKLRELPKPGQKIIIVTSDISRPLPTYDVLPPVLEELDAAVQKILQTIDRQPEAAVTWFCRDPRKQGGSYVCTRGRVKKVDVPGGLLLFTSGETVPLKEIAAISLEEEYSGP